MSGNQNTNIKLKPRELKKQKSIEKITETAKKMMLEGSYFTTTTRRIAKAAEVSIGLIYNYFPKGKPQIAYEICKQEYAQFLKEVKIPTLTSENLLNFIKTFLSNFIQFHKERAPLIAALDIAYLSKKDHLLDFDEEDILDMNPIPQILENMNKSGLIEKKKLEKLNSVLLNTIESIIHRHTNIARIFDTDEELAEFLTYLTLKILRFKPM